jgi:hypothetical protein
MMGHRMNLIRRPSSFLVILSVHPAGICIAATSPG